MKLFRLLCLPCLGVPAAALSQTSYPADGIFAYIEAGRSYKILGSRDVRDGAEIGVQRVLVDAYLRKLAPTIHEVETLYVMGHQGNDLRYGETHTLALGAMYGMRVDIGPRQRYFAEYSFGTQFDTVRSHGLPSEFNVTPTFLFGTVIPGKRPVEIGVTFTHISNMYTQRPNFGLDLAQVLVGVKV